MKHKIFDYLINKYGVRMNSMIIREVKKDLDNTKVSDLVLWCQLYSSKKY